MKAKKILASVLAGALALTTMGFTALADGETEADTSWYNTTDTTFRLDTAADLLGLAELVNDNTDSFSGKTVELANDIDLDGVDWTPIGKTGDVQGFKGTFDGKDYTISNLTVDLNDVPGSHSAGLFGSASFGTIQNLIIDGATVKNVHNCDLCDNGTAVVVGSSQFDETITNVTVKNATVESNHYVGGIAGYFAGTIENCKVDNVIVKATSILKSGNEYGDGDKAGGVVGYLNPRQYAASNTNIISECNVKDVDVSGYRDVGGVAGCATTITECKNTTIDGNIKVTVDQSTNSYGPKDANASVFIGRTDNNPNLTISNNTVGEDFVPAVTITDTTGNVTEPNYVAAVGVAFYESLADAVADAEDGDTVTLLCDAEGDGIIVPENSNFTLDFGGHTYTVTDNLVGSSPEYYNQAFQLLSGSTLKFKNGTINFADDIAKKARFVIQNYANLTLEDMTLDGSNMEGQKNDGTKYANVYTMSNNCGTVSIEGRTNIIASTAADASYAFDVCKFGNYTEPTVTVNTDGTIDGKIEVTTPQNTNLVIKKGNFTVATANVNGQSTPLTTFVPDANKNDVLINAEKVAVKFEQVNQDDNSLYNIKVVGADGAQIKMFTNADLTFELTKEQDKALAYEILEVEGSYININNVGEDRYEFHFNGVNQPSETGNEIKIGQVKFTGEGDFTFSVANANTNKVYGATADEELITKEFTGDTLVINDENVDGTIIDSEITVPTYELKVVVSFPQTVENKVIAYQKMQAVISGGDLTDNIVVDFGNDSNDVTFDANECAYTFTQELTQDVAYTVTISGNGYRTARYQVLMDKEKTLNFWNNVKLGNSAQAIEEGKTPMETNFLAGDIVKDNKINIYDLSAVVSYFNTNLAQNPDDNKIKYDLNRDGKIDSRDISYILLAWGK